MGRARNLGAQSKGAAARPRNRIGLLSRSIQGLLAFGLSAPLAAGNGLGVELDRSERFSGCQSSSGRGSRWLHSGRLRIAPAKMFSSDGIFVYSITCGTSDPRKPNVAFNERPAAGFLCLRRIRFHLLLDSIAPPT